MLPSAEGQWGVGAVAQCKCGWVGGGCYSLTWVQLGRWVLLSADGGVLQAGGYYRIQDRQNLVLCRMTSPYKKWQEWESLTEQLATSLLVSQWLIFEAAVIHFYHDIQLIVISIYLLTYVGQHFKMSYHMFSWNQSTLCLQQSQHPLK